MKRIAGVRKGIGLPALFLMAIAVLCLTAAAPENGNQAPFSETKIYFEYNSTANDLGVHVFLDAEDWKTLRILNPNGRTIFNVQGGGGFRQLGMTELFFEGAEPALDEFPLDELLALFPEGEYRFNGTTVDGAELEGTATFTHAVPDGPKVSAVVRPDHTLVIRWRPVTGPAGILPDEDIEIAGYQVIVEEFQVTLPETATRVTVPPEYVASLGPGEHDFEVLAIEEGGNQTITEGSFTIP
ncbi:MAG: hypothetical protein AB1640_21465 [bacterium]